MSTTQGGGNIVTDGLVLCLDATNAKSYPGTGTIWTDLSRSGNNGILTNNPTFNSSNGGSIVFDGSNDYVSSANITTTNQISVEAWVYANSISSYNGIVTQYSTGNPSTSSWILETFGSNAYFFIANGSNLYFGLVPFSTGVWVHLVGVYNGNLITIYKNGVIGTSTSISTTINTSERKVNIGALYSSGGVEGGDGLWNGRISNVSTLPKSRRQTGAICQNQRFWFAFQDAQSRCESVLRKHRF
jgi:hypothetical protein